MLRLGLVAAAIGLTVGFAPAIARAQTNLDEGKSATQIFASDCSVCHKSPKGLGKGHGGAGGIASFLRQHYTTGREQAASLAAYIMGAGGDTGDSQTRGRKPAAERTARPAEEPLPKPTRQTRRPPMRGEETPEAKQPGVEDEPRPPEPIAVEEPAGKPSRKPPARGRKPAAAEPEPRTSAAVRGRRAVPEPPPAASPPTAAEPAAAEPTPTAAAPPPAPASDVTPVPRDDIPD